MLCMYNDHYTKFFFNDFIVLDNTKELVIDKSVELERESEREKERNGVQFIILQIFSLQKFSQSYMHISTCCCIYFTYFFYLFFFCEQSH